MSNLFPNILLTRHNDPSLIQIAVKDRTEKVDEKYKESDFMVKNNKYTLRCIKTGKEWKEFTTGMEFLDDNKKYRIEWELDSFINYLRAWYGIIRKTPHTLTKVL